MPVKAIRHHRFGDPEVLVLDELPTPEPAPGEVLIRIEAAAVNHYDILSRRGIRADLPLPRIVGIDCAGYVEVYRGERTNLPVGQPVVVLGERLGNGGPGAYATHVCITEEEVFPLPASLDIVTAACLGISYLTAWYALVEGERARVGDWLFIPGAGGGVGSAALQIAAALGLRVIATSGTAAKCAQAVALGAAACVDYREEDVAAAVRRLTGGRGVPLALNAVGGAVVQQSLDCLERGGTLLAVGTAYGRPFSFDGFDFLVRELRIEGINITHQSSVQRHAMLLKLAEQIAAGRIRVQIDRALPLAAAAQAHRLIEERAHFGKVLLLP
jgi:NADPH2:quinone reductase